MAVWFLLPCDHLDTRETASLKHNMKVLSDFEEYQSTWPGSGELANLVSWCPARNLRMEPLHVEYSTNCESQSESLQRRCPIATITSQGRSWQHYFWGMCWLGILCSQLGSSNGFTHGCSFHLRRPFIEPWPWRRKEERGTVKTDLSRYLVGTLRIVCDELVPY